MEVRERKGEKKKRREKRGMRGIEATEGEKKGERKKRGKGNNVNRSDGGRERGKETRGEERKIR